MERERLDLFGNPVREGKGKRGRPAFEATDRISNKVKLLLAMGWSNDRIANAIEVSLATLKRYFRADLLMRDQMRDRLEAERLLAVAEMASAGNVGAHRELARLIDRNDRMEFERAVAKAPAVKTAEKLGKKVVNDQLAHEADAELNAELELEAAQGVRH